MFEVWRDRRGAFYPFLAERTGSLTVEVRWRSIFLAPANTSPLLTRAEALVQHRSLPAWRWRGRRISDGGPRCGIRAHWCAAIRAAVSLCEKSARQSRTTRWLFRRQRETTHAVGRRSDRRCARPAAERKWEMRRDPPLRGWAVCRRPDGASV